MDIYAVTINGELWNVPASSISSAVRKAINLDNSDREMNGLQKLDFEIKNHNLYLFFTIDIIIEGATEQDILENCQNLKVRDESN